MSDRIGGPRSPEEVAKDYLKEHGDFVPDFPEPGSHWPRWIAAGVAVAVVAGALLAVVLVDRPAARGTGSRQLDATARAQAAANRLAIGAGCPADPSARANGLEFAAPGAVLKPKTLYAALVRTTAGTFQIALNVLAAPQTVNSFVFLADHGYFNCNDFLAAKSGAFDLTGDPTGSGRGGPGYSVREPVSSPSAPTDPSMPGAVVLRNGATSGGGGSQWYIAVGSAGAARPADGVAFGQVISGLSVVRKINADGSTDGTPRVTQRILSVTIRSKTV